MSVFLPKMKNVPAKHSISGIFAQNEIISSQTPYFQDFCLKWDIFPGKHPTVGNFAQNWKFVFLTLYFRDFGPKWEFFQLTSQFSSFLLKLVIFQQSTVFSGFLPRIRNFSAEQARKSRNEKNWTMPPVQIKTPKGVDQS